MFKQRHFRRILPALALVPACFGMECISTDLNLTPPIIEMLVEQVLPPPPDLPFESFRYTQASLPGACSRPGQPNSLTIEKREDGRYLVTVVVFLFGSSSEHYLLGSELPPEVQLPTRLLTGTEAERIRLVITQLETIEIDEPFEPCASDPCRFESLVLDGEWHALSGDNCSRGHGFVLSSQSRQAVIDLAGTFYP